MIIDSHVHITENGKWFNSNIDASLGRLMREMDEAEVDKAVLLALPDYIPNEFIYKVCREYPDQFMGAGGINPNQPDCLNEMEKCFYKYEFRVLKLHPRYNNFIPLGINTLKVLEKAEKFGVTVIFDGYVQSDTLLLSDLQPLVYDVIAKKFPDLKLIIAHMGYPKLIDAYTVAKSNKNIYLDLSYILPDLYENEMLSSVYLSLRKLDRKVLYGSDFPEVGLFEYKKFFFQVASNTPDEKLKNVLYHNAKQILGF